MPRVVIIGGTGHVGTYLVPRLVEAGMDVISVSRGEREPYWPHAAWGRVRRVAIDRDAEEKLNAFGPAIRTLKPDIVIDMICFKEASAAHLAEALSGHVGHFLHTGTIWTHGPTVEAPTLETQPRRPFGDYGIRKAAIERLLLEAAHRRGFPVTILHPGHIVGVGWVPLNPEGHFNPVVFSKLAKGEEVLLPNLGLETVHHVHADDVAALFMAAIANRSAALGESFHAVSPAALSLRGFAEGVAAWFGREPNLTYLPWEAWKARHSALEVEQTYDHIAHSPNCSMAKAERLLGFTPRFRSLEAVTQSVEHLIKTGVVETG